MAITRTTNAVSLKTVLNYGTVEGVVVRKTKSYSNVKKAAADQNLMDAYNAITGMQQPIAENCFVQTMDELTETE